MQKDERDLLEVLKSELNFLDKGGYGRSTREPWRPVLVFEDSPTCMNYDCKTNPAPCGACVLMQLLPPELRLGKLPCRQIPLNAAGENLDSLYRYGDQHEIEEALRNWLLATIAQLEARQNSSSSGSASQAPASGEPMNGIALHQNADPKCANPGCSIAFHWLQGGKFFRFRPNDEAQDLKPGVADRRNDTHGAKHFWLCEYCSHIFTLVYDAEAGVVLKLLWPEIPLAEARQQLASAQQN